MVLTRGDGPVPMVQPWGKDSKFQLEHLSGTFLPRIAHQALLWHTLSQTVLSSQVQCGADQAGNKGGRQTHWVCIASPRCQQSMWPGLCRALNKFLVNFLFSFQKAKLVIAVFVPIWCKPLWKGYLLSLTLLSKKLDLMKVWALPKEGMWDSVQVGLTH